VEGQNLDLTGAAQACGIPAETLVAVSHALGAAKKPVIVFGKGITRSSDGALQAIEELAAAINAVLLNPMGKANSFAAHALHLDKPFNPAGYKLIYLALGDDFTTPRLEKVVGQDRGEGAPFLVVQASYVSAVTEMADVVLPVEMWAEQSGHYFNLEGRLQKSSQVLAPVATIRSNQLVFKTLASETGVELDESWREALVVNA
jgi:predicted molibdopterin-dependent oxidoreductase YjgC